jgi:hypothetical protein
MKKLMADSENLFPKSDGNYSNRVVYFEYPFLSIYITNTWTLLENGTNYMLYERFNAPIKKIKLLVDEFAHDIFER